MLEIQKSPRPSGIRNYDLEAIAIPLCYLAKHVHCTQWNTDLAELRSDVFYSIIFVGDEHSKDCRRRLPQSHSKLQVRGSRVLKSREHWWAAGFESRFPSFWAFLTLDLASKGHQGQSSENSLAKLFSDHGCQRNRWRIKKIFEQKTILRTRS